MPILVVQQNNTGRLTRTCMHPAQYDARGTRIMNAHIMNAHIQCWALHVCGAGVHAGRKRSIKLRAAANVPA
jgi:hypothetical protein